MIQTETAKISALSSNNLDKYKLLTGEDLDLKPSTIEQTKFEYSPLGKIFNKGLSEDDKKEGLFKRLENIKDKNEELINTLSATNKASKSNVLKYNTQYSSVKLKNIDDIKKLPLDPMFNFMKEHHKKQEGQYKEQLDLEETIDANVNEEIFQKYFRLQKPSLMYKVLFTLNDKEKNINLVNVFNSGLKD